MKLVIPAGDFAGYLFDLDGTLVDTMPLHYAAWREALRRGGLGRELEEDYFYSLGGVPTRLVAQRIGEHYGGKLDAEKVEHVKEALYLERLRDAKLITPVVTFARRVAKTHPVAVVTGGMPNVAQSALQLTGLDTLFQIVVTPADVPSGCRFHTRCPRFLGDICRQQEPPWREGDGDHHVYCHIPLEELLALQKRPEPPAAGAPPSAEAQEV